MPESSPSEIKWTPPQRVAVEHVAGDLLVSAAAGSGKTAVLAERCARLVCHASHATGIDNLLVVTFTEAAAGEMRTRIVRAIERTAMEATGAGQDAWLRRQAAMVDRASISTLHAFCARILRQHFHEADVDPAFAVMDEDDARLMRDEVLEGLLARWHKLPPRTPDLPLDGERFTEFFESYAQGSDAALCRQILAVHRMLSTTADPVKFASDARAAYGAGVERFFAAYSSVTLMGALRRAHLIADRACREVESVAHTEKMRKPLRDARQALEDAIELLAAEGASGWGSIAAVLKPEWPKRLMKIDDVPDFEGLKARTWTKVKDVLKNLVPVFERDPARLLADLKSLGKPLETLLALTTDFQQAFAGAKRAQNCLDFNDLERFALNVLVRPDQAVASDLRRRYHHVLVDEFQDINPLQAALLDAVRNPAAFEGQGNYFRVGDVKQSIYGFRLAEPEEFQRQEEVARSGGDGAHRRFLALPHNFRSRPGLIAAMNGIFSQLLTPAVTGIDYRDLHALQAPPTPAEKVPAQARAIEVHLLDTSDASKAEAIEESGEEPGEDDAAAGEAAPDAALPLEHEARMVAARVKAILAEGRVVKEKDGRTRELKAGDIAVLLRAMKGRALIFARAFSRAGIALHAELSTGYFDAPEIANTLALLHVLDNPEQDIPMAAVLLGPYGNFTHDDLAIIRLTYDRTQVSFAVAAARYGRDARDGGAEAAAAGLLAAHAPDFSVALAARLLACLAQLALWRSWLQTRPLHEGLAEIYAASKILVHVAGLEAGAQRVANLQQLHRRALTFSTFRKQGLHRFLRFLERQQEEDNLGGGDGDAGAAVLADASNSVRLMSIHKSKGLEFPVVVVAGLGARLRLHNEPPLVHRALGIGLDVIDLPRQLRYDSVATLRIADALDRAHRAEELRLLYVAMTRAQDTLVLSGHIQKKATLDEWRTAWSHHNDALPEDVLLGGSNPLDWIMPAVASLGASGMRVSWPGEDAPADAAVAVTLHGKEEAEAKPALAAPSEMAARLLAGGPLPDVPADARVEELFARLGRVYPHAAAAARAAVQTVTALKTLQPQIVEDEAAEIAPGMGDVDGGDVVSTSQDDAPGAGDTQARSEAARLRGIATHRILELVDLADVTPAALDRQRAAWMQRRAISAEDLGRADWPGIRWFLNESESGRRLRAAASSPETIVRREIPFAWLAAADLAPAPSSWLVPPLVDGGDPSVPAPEDLPTIRGIIDVLIASPAARAAEIMDYKTDAAFLVDQRLDAYRRQMQYYLRAAGDILGFAVPQATLIFLAARREVIVRG